uniref:Uncharacterized protein n=1 Tax=Oryza nivara TaxID=4536 RepID=A0A0E0FHQ2_ORYNI
MATSNDEFWQRDANKTSAKNRVNAIDKPEQQRRRRDLILAISYRTHLKTMTVKIFRNWI